MDITNVFSNYQQIVLSCDEQPYGILYKNTVIIDVDTYFNLLFTSPQSTFAPSLYDTYKSLLEEIKDSFPDISEFENQYEKFTSLENQIRSGEIKNFFIELLSKYGLDLTEKYLVIPPKEHERLIYNREIVSNSELHQTFIDSKKSYFSIMDQDQFISLDFTSEDTCYIYNEETKFFKILPTVPTSLYPGCKSFIIEGQDSKYYCLQSTQYDFIFMVNEIAPFSGSLQKSYKDVNLDTDLVYL